MTCEVGDTLYMHEIKETNMEFFFDAILQLVGVKFGDRYKPLDKIHQPEKVLYPHLLQIADFLTNALTFNVLYSQNLVETLKQKAYENIKDVQYDHIMINNCPVPLHKFHAKGASGLSNALQNQQILNYGTILPVL